MGYVPNTYTASLLCQESVDHKGVGWGERERDVQVEVEVKVEVERMAVQAKRQAEDGQKNNLNLTRTYRGRHKDT
jgi:hypothetical protein